MSFFSWLMRKPPAKRQLPQPSAPLNAAALASQPGRTHKPAEQTGATKNERMERRELLYIVVRDAMVCAGVLSASYKFKVLSLDPRGLQFLVMMDLAAEFGGETVRLSEIEALIAQTAKARYNISVTAVYWRINENVSAGAVPSVSAAPKSAALPPANAAHPTISPASTAPRTIDLSRPAHTPTPAAGVAAAPTHAPAAPSHHAHPARHAPTATVPAALDSAQPSSAAPVRLVVPRFEPIEADEVAAFKQALATAAAARAPAAAPAGVPHRSGPRRPAPVNDFPDTVMPDQDSRAQSLSSTQYGEL